MSFGAIDWAVFGGYFAVLALSSWLFARVRIDSARDFFVGGNRIGMFAAAVSILATSQSAATFLGAPDFSYRKDWTFLGFYASALLAVVFVAGVLVPRFYAMRAVTVYELLEKRYGPEAKRAAGAMFLLGRIFASGARLYIGALAVAMLLYGDIEAPHMAVSIGVLLAGALAYAAFGGVRSVIYSDAIQAFTYVGAGIAVLVYLMQALSADPATLWHLLATEEKLTLVRGGGTFGIASLLVGWTLLNIAAYGLDQDMTQRVLSCRDGRSGARALYVSMALTVPVALLFLAIGSLLYLYYRHPELSGFEGTLSQVFAGEKVTVFMHFILDEMPEGLRGLVTVGAIAAALSSTNSVLSAMASVAVEDFYRPFARRRGMVEEAHFVRAGRIAVAVFALALGMMAMLSYYWQRASDVPLLAFALAVMSFAYAGLLGVYAAAIFTRRGSAHGVSWALGGGFFTVAAMQPQVVPALAAWFPAPWPLAAGTAVSFAIMQAVSPRGAQRQ